jgi:hypothetical protein
VCSHQQSSLFNVSEHQDGAIRILYQSRTCNNIMQGGGHIHSQCKHDDEYQYRYNYDGGVSWMNFYVRGMDLYTRHGWIFSFSICDTNVFMSLGGQWFHYVEQLWRIAREEHKTHV